ncbi:autotransporter assembly complex protein TamA [Roseicyclus mahoneyensis]|uniref:Autotransporter secretion outer membrane protein TamA n=1 Tax=Roseicyclus mahoneyensis TaxID=164332 RepID=A0A316GMZ4_9RHOB|nr:BamA/TamA family outer membrane protein [Roseicyclus mahoneyensis]PWK61619.1 autotransporter secretion outer membrane protein TamA [Roseicyclus mahoneyensis]
MPAVSRKSFALIRATIAAAAVAMAPLAVSGQEVTLRAPSASEDLIDRLRANALLLRTPEEGTVRTGQDITAAARADYGRLIGILYEQGFFAPVITIRLDGRDAAGISPFDAPAQVTRVEIDIETGPPFLLGRAEIGPLAANTDLPDGFRPGETATTPLLRATTRAALEGWQNQGHATADVASQQITAQNRAAILDVAIRVDPGPVITFGSLIPEGQQRMRVERILEIAGLPTGEVYSPAALERAEERLRDTSVFSAVALRLRDPEAGDVADVTATLAEAPLRRLGFGAELASDEGLLLSAYWLHRNLLGGGERLRFDLEIAGIQEFEGDGVDAEFRARFERPATFTPDTSLAVEGALVFLQEPTFTIQGIGVEASLTHRLSRTVTVAGGVGLTYSEIEDGLGARDITRFTLPLRATYENRDDPIDARGGAYADLTLTPFQVIGGGGGARFTLDGRGYWGLGAEERTRLAARVQLGSLFGGDLIDIAPDDLFYSGGSGTVRGQAYRSLGALQGGVPSGGRGFVGLSGEVRHDIGDTNFGIVGFADAGYVSEGAWGDGAADWHAGVGLGLRYATPFGPIRIDLATPASGNNAGTEAYLYIGIGQAF